MEVALEVHLTLNYFENHRNILRAHEFFKNSLRKIFSFNYFYSKFLKLDPQIQGFLPRAQFAPSTNLPYKSLLDPNEKSRINFSYYKVDPKYHSLIDTGSGFMQRQTNEVTPSVTQKVFPEKSLSFPN